MKRFQIFKPGRHTASSGATLEFSEADLRRAAEVYDPAVSEAPIVVGHPSTNGPAYGWVGAMHFADGLDVEPIQVDEQFSEMVAAGRFKKRSASWYMPGSAAHPLAGKPGHDAYYLRHVGFLGAQPPAVKGLKPVEFGEAADGVVEFAEPDRWAWSSVAAVVRGWREWLIGEKGLEAADKIVPNYLLSDIEAAAKAPAPDTTAGAMPAFSEGDDMSKELQAEVERLRAENATLKTSQKPADFAERESALAAREAKVAESEAKASRASIAARIEAAVSAGRMLPAQKKHAVEFALGLADDAQTVEFGEGDKAKKVSLREAYLLQIETGPKVIEFGELSRETGEGGDNRPPIAEVQRSLSQQVFSGGASPAKA